MPTVVIHEEVAYEIAKIYTNLDTGDFYLGVLAPDAVNLNGFAPKEERYKSHIRNKDLNVWLSNVKEFFQNNKNKYEKNFLLGYILHIITDIVYDQYFYWPVREQLAKDNIKEEEQHQILRTSMEEYGYQNEKEPFWLHAKKRLSNVEGYNIQNIKKEDLLLWKNKCLQPLKSQKTNKYITKSQIMELTNKVERIFKVFIT